MSNKKLIIRLNEYYENNQHGFYWSVYEDNIEVCRYIFKNRGKDLENTWIIKIPLLRYVIFDLFFIDKQVINISITEDEFNYIKNEINLFKEWCENKEIKYFEPILEINKDRRNFKIEKYYLENHVLLGNTGGKDSTCCELLLDLRKQIIEEYTFNIDNEDFNGDFYCGLEILDDNLYKKYCTKEYFLEQNKNFYQEDDMHVIYAAPLLKNLEHYSNLAVGIQWDMLYENKTIDINSYVISESLHSIKNLESLMHKYGFDNFKIFSPIASVTSVGVYNILKKHYGADKVDNFISCWYPRDNLACQECDKCKRISIIKQIVDNKKILQSNLDNLFGSNAMKELINKYSGKQNDVIYNTVLINDEIKDFSFGFEEEIKKYFDFIEKNNFFIDENKNLLKIFIGTFFTVLGNNIMRFATSIYIFDITGKATDTAIILIISILPSIVFSGLGGFLADSYMRKNVMIATDVLATVCLMLFLLYPETVNIYVLIFFISTLTAINLPSARTIIPRMVNFNAKMISKANAKMSMIVTLAEFMAPMLSILIYSKYGFLMVCLANLLTFCIAAFLEVFIREMPMKKVVHKKQTILPAYIDALKMVHKTDLRKYFLISTITNIILTPLIYVGFIKVSNEYFNANESKIMLSYMESLLIFGAFLASLIYQKIKLAESIVFQGALFLIGIAFILYIFAESDYFKWFVLVINFLIGACIAVYNIGIYNKINLSVDTKRQGVILGLMFIITNSCIPIGYYVLSRFLDIYDTKIIFGVGGLIIIFSTIIIFSLNNFKYLNVRGVK